MDSPEKLEKKKLFYETLSTPWHFQKELQSAVESQVKVLTVACCNFLKVAFEFQQKIKSFSNVVYRGWIHPFDRKISSISGFTYNLCSFYFLGNENIHGVNNPTSGKSTNSSRSEMEFCFFKSTLEPEKNWQHLYNRADGQKSFGKYKVDLYSPVEKKVIEFHGCVTHFHLPPDCVYKENLNKTPSSLNPFGVPYSNLKIQDEARKTHLLSKYSDDILEFEIQHECLWREQKKTEFFKSINFVFQDLKLRPINRLNPRSTVRGGISEVYCLRWQKEFHPDETFYYSDVQGLYSYAAITKPLPKGKYEIFIGDNLTNEIEFRDGFHFFGAKKLICGAAQVTVRPPENLEKPFLQFRIFDTFNFLGLCRLCILRKQKNCQHRENRYFTSNWLFSDLRKAVLLGYRIDHWHEIYYFAETSNFLSLYSSLWYAEKIQSSGFPSEIKTDEEKLQYCHDINHSLQLPEDFYLKPESIEKNPARRQLAKSCLNNLYGKFSQQTPSIKREFVTSQIRLEEILAQYNVTNLTNLSEKMLHVEYETQASTQVSKSNLFVGAQINAYGREIIYEHMQSIEQVGGKVFSVDVDGLFYSLPNHVPHPLRFSNQCGDFKNMLPEGHEAVAFYAMGVKNYCLVYKNPQGTIESTIKVKGLSLTSHCVNEKITPEIYQKFIASHFQEQTQAILIPQSKFCIDENTRTNIKKYQQFTFSNELYLKRFIPKNTNSNSKQIDEASIIETLPFGFKKKLKVQ